MRKQLLLALFAALLPVGTANAQSGGSVLVPNSATTGTLISALAKYTTAGTAAVRTSVTDTAAIPGYIGIVISGPGTTGNAVIATGGIWPCFADGGGITAGHYVINSTTTDGSCRDGGTTTPLVQTVGIATSTASSGALANVFLFGPSSFGTMSPAGNNTLTGSIIMSPVNIAATGALDMTLAGGNCGKNVNYTGTAAGTLTIGSGATVNCSVTVTATSANVLGLATIAVTGGTFKSGAACTTNPRTAALGSSISVRIISNAGSAPVVTVAGECG